MNSPPLRLLKKCRVVAVVAFIIFWYSYDFEGRGKRAPRRYHANPEPLVGHNEAPTEKDRGEPPANTVKGHSVEGMANEVEPNADPNGALIQRLSAVVDTPKPPDADVADCKKKQLIRLHQSGDFLYMHPFHRLALTANFSSFLPCGAGVSRDGGVFLDIGADGFWIKLWGRKRNRMDCKSSLILMEANPMLKSQVEATAESLKAVHFDNVHTIMKAAYNESGTQQLFFNARENSNSSDKASLIEGKYAAKSFPDHPHTNVETTTVDEVVKQLNLDSDLFVPIMKVNTRGTEFEVLQGSIATLKRTHAVLFSCNHHWRQPTKLAVDLLEEMGFHVYKVSHAGLVKMYEPYWDPLFEKARGDHQCFALRRQSPVYRSVLMACEKG